MSEGIKAVLPMVSSHPTGPNPSKWELLKGEVHQGVIEQQTTAGSLIEEFSLDLLALSEDIQCQWLGPAVDHLDCFFRGVNIDNGQDRTKYFILVIISKLIDSQHVLL